MTKRRSLTQAEQQAAHNLKRAYAEAKQHSRANGQRLTHDVVGDAVGMTPAAISQYMNGGIPLSLTAASKFAKFFNIPLESINPDFADLLPNATVPPSKYSDLTNSLPLLSWVQAGSWQEIVSENTGEGEVERIICPVKHSPHAFALRVKGHSMHNPAERLSFDDGDIIHVDPAVPAEHNSLVVVRLEDSEEATFKQLIVESGQKFLKALNPSWPNRIIELPADAVVCGVVISKTVSFC